MPMKKTWLLRVTEIREELEGLQAPVIDRAMCERIFGVRRRRALQLMHSFGGWQSGQAFQSTAWPCCGNWRHFRTALK